MFTWIKIGGAWQLEMMMMLFTKNEIKCHELAELAKIVGIGLFSSSL